MFAIRSSRRAVWGKRTVIITVRSSGRPVWGKRTVIIAVRSSGRPAWGKRTAIITVRSSGRPAWGKRRAIIAVRSFGRPVWGKRLVCPAGGGDGHSAAILAIHSRNCRSTAGPFSEPNASASSGPSSSPPALPDEVAQLHPDQQPDRLPQVNDRPLGRRRQHAVGQAVHPVEQPALLRLAQRKRRRVPRRTQLDGQPRGNRVIVDRHAAPRSRGSVPTPNPGTRS